MENNLLVSEQPTFSTFLFVKLFKFIKGIAQVFCKLVKTSPSQVKNLQISYKALTQLKMKV